MSTTLQPQTLRVRNNLGNPGIQSESMGTGFVRLKTETCSGNQPSGSIEGGEFYDQKGGRCASQVGFCSVVFNLKYSYK